jgi:predicted nucleic acid-binding protein
VPDAWVFNASPIILYARIGRLDLIDALAPGVIVPEKVIEEVKHGASKDDTADEAICWAMRYKQHNKSIPPSVERWDLGPGESQVISFCLQGKRWAVMDDRMARRCISAHGLQVIGSLGMILRAKICGLIDVAKPWVYKLHNEGMYVGADLLEKALTLVGEGK